MELKTIMLLSFIFAEIISLLITNNKIKTNKKTSFFISSSLAFIRVFSFLFFVFLLISDLGLGVIE